jgi:hypothetical protein
MYLDDVWIKYSVYYEDDRPVAVIAKRLPEEQIGHILIFEVDKDLHSKGIGKSVISTQLLVPWAMGKPGLIGSAPLAPLRIAIIQAEDDDTEMAEFRRDHRLGHVAEGWKLEEVLEAERKVADWSPFFRGKVGDDFLRGLDFALRRQPSDVVIMNPLQSYTNIDLNKNKDLSEFLMF